jgi:uncharacterized protein (TIGR02246 family)
VVKKTVFRQSFAMLVFLALVGCVSISEAAPIGKSGLPDPADAEAIKQLEQDIGDAMVASDVEKLNQFYADDWAVVGSSGKVITKQTIINDFKSFHDKLLWFENGPIDVQMFGNVAVACARVKEKRIRNGKDTSGESVWVDVLEKRAGKWVVVDSAGARLK